MSVGKPSLDYMKDKINKAQDEKQAIIYMVETDEKIQRKIKEIEKNAWKETLKQKPEKFNFNPKEIESIIFKNKDKEER